MSRSLVGAVLASLLFSSSLGAQTDWHNLDRGRPLITEDALPLERHAFEAEVAPLRLQRGAGAAYAWAFEPAIAFGVLPRTHVELGLPIARTDAVSGARRRFDVGGVHAGVMYALNTETLRLPGIALGADWLAPFGGASAPVSGLLTSRVMITRTLANAMRVHVNADRTLGHAGGAPGTRRLGAAALDVPRWHLGAALDLPRALDAMLVAVETFARRPLAGGAVEWTSAIGTRRQLDPRWVMDAGISRRWRGAPEWSVTVGTAVAFAPARRMGGR